MKKILSSSGLEVIEKNFYQVIIRGDGQEQFNQIINREISLSPPSKNLETIVNGNFLFAKNSFDQWSLIYLKDNDYEKVLQFISNLNIVSDNGSLETISYKDQFGTDTQINFVNIKLNDELDKKIFDYNKETILVILN